MKHFFLLLIAPFMLVAHSSFADNKPVSFGVGSYWWGTEVSGGLYGEVDPSFISSSSVTIRPLELSFSSFYTEPENNGSFFGYLEHSNKWLPHIRLSYTTLANQGTNGLFFHPALTEPADVLVGEIDVSHWDLGLYYKVINNDYSQLSLGLNGRVIEGSLTLDAIIHFTSSDARWKTSSDISSELLLLYADLKFFLPLGFSLESTIMGGKNSSEEGLDASIMAQYTSPVGIAVGAGYRIFDSKLTSETNNNIVTELNSDLQFKGFFLQLAYHY